MNKQIDFKNLVSVIKEEVEKHINENGFNQYDMQTDPVTKQQQIDASWNEFNNNNKTAFDNQRKNADIESYLDTNLNSDNLNGQLAMDAQSDDKSVADTAQMTIGTPRQTANNYEIYQNNNFKMEMKQNQFRNLIKECLTEVINERQTLKEDADGGWFKRLQKMYNILSAYLKENNPNAYQYLITHQDDDGVIEDMYSMYKEGLLGKEIKESVKVDRNKYIPKRVFNAVAKLNQALKEFAEYTGDEYPELLDTSTGTESFFTIKSEIKIENGYITLLQQDAYNFKGPDEERWNLVREDEDGEIWFDEYEFKDTVGYLNKCLKKAIRYFKEYDPDKYDNDNNKREKFLDSL